MAESTEPRALTAVLAAPAFATKVGPGILHAATRHAERWAPESSASNVRTLRNLGFVDRLVAPWIEAAQRSASLRLFSQYRSHGMPERATTQTSWLFPRPWYQDELDWMAAARQVSIESSDQSRDSNAAPSMLTTRGTYVAPSAARTAMAMPTALYEYVAPSLSIASPQATAAGAATAVSAAMPQLELRNAYSPLVPAAAAHAAQVIQRAISPLFAQPIGEHAPVRAPTGPSSTTSMTSMTPSAMSPGLRAVLSAMLERTAISAEPTRLSMIAPELVTPPAPRADAVATGAAAVAAEPVATHAHDDVAASPVSQTLAARTAIELQAQRAQLVELQRAARAVAARELSARVEAAARAAAPSASSSSSTTSELDARVAQRLAERQQEQLVVEHARATLAREQRLHEAARESAARDARTAASAEFPSSATIDSASSVRSQSTQAQPTPRALPIELLNAMVALTPALASTVAASLARDPARAEQTIGELNDALRTAELIARTTATGGSFESVRGPRLVMPAGLGGLVATVEQTASASSATTAATAASRRTSGARELADTSRSMRVPAPTWVAPTSAIGSTATGSSATGSPIATNALAAAQAARPAALQHVAWADRWLARFAGARPESLAVLAAASATSSAPTLIASIAGAAPDAVFVAPRAIAAEPAQAQAAPSAVAAPADVPVQRFDDNAETPDDVFASIAAAAGSARSRGRAAVSQQRAAQPVAEPANVGLERATFADVVAHAVPSAPNAGLSVQLASSPFAPAFRHVLPLAAAPSFDVRALFGNNLVASYLAGVLASSTDALPMAMREPAWLPASAIGSDAIGEVARNAIEFEPSYVAPIGESPAAPASIASTVPIEQAASSEQASGEQAALERQLVTVRSALLALDLELTATNEVARTTATLSATTTSAPEPAAGVARAMAMAMSLPMIGELATIGDAVGVAHAAGLSTPGVSYAAPGMIADRAQAWSIAQERSASDLAFDFVTPELVLAARVYGLGPAEAAQAARLAIAGPGALATMAGAVDRTFVQALAVEAERRTQVVTAYPRGAASTTADSPAVASASSTSTPTATTATTATTSAPMLPTSAFGVERRAPRGAFMWPPATIAALGLSAASPDGEQAMSVAALELLAAQAVAELGTYAAFAPDHAGSSESRSQAPQSTAVAALPASSPVPSGELGDAELLAAATAMVPAGRRAKLEAMYVALGQSQTSRSWSPAARAARALALAGRGDETITAYERASIAWDVLPMVAPALAQAASAASTNDASYLDELAPGASRSTGITATAIARAQAQAAAKQTLSLPEYVESRPGLATLSARAGEALGSYVAPAAPPVQPAAATSSRDGGAMRRVPTAAQEMVRTGRPAGRFGGGEVEIPTWFEAAARKMFDDKASGGPASDLSLAELTLITAAPSNQIAASSRSQPSAVPVNPNPNAQAGLATKDTPIDIEKVANDVYRQILVMMDAARARNGEPYL